MCVASIRTQNAFLALRSFVLSHFCLVHFGRIEKEENGREKKKCVLHLVNVVWEEIDCVYRQEWKLFLLADREEGEKIEPIPLWQSKKVATPTQKERSKQSRHVWKSRVFRCGPDQEARRRRCLVLSMWKYVLLNRDRSCLYLRRL